ncbi:MAG: winged helix-turn-helix domain-containing protein [Bryobacteraceae bacterium]
MSERAGSESLFQFGVFELDFRAGELRKRGIRIKIQEQPLQILHLLIQCPGEVITREQIQKKLWNDDTFVGFDNAINSAVRKMRDALGDSSENPRFVETVAKHGYRFIVPVKQHLTPAPPVQENPPTTAAQARLPEIGIAKPEIVGALAAPAQRPVALGAKRGRMPWWIVVGALLAAAGPAVWQGVRTPAQELWSGIMLSGPAKAFEPRLSPDGQLLAFLIFIDQLPQLAIMKPNGGSWTILTSDREHGYITTAAWAPDGSKIYFDRMWGQPLGIYSVPPLGGVPRMLLDEAFGPEPLPDGSLIVVKLTDKGDNQLFHFWPESGRLEPLPAFLQKSDITPMLRAFPGGKELVYFGTSDGDRSQSARMLVFDLASRRARELAPNLRVDPGTDGWSPLAAAPGGESVYLISRAGDTRWLTEVPRKPGRKPRALLSFPDSAMPVGMDVARDGSLYLDLLRDQFVVLRVNASGGAGEEFGLPTNDFLTMVSPKGDVLLTLPGMGRRRLAAMHPGGEPQILVETSEDTTLPATIFGDKVAFVIGTGDQRRIAVASLRDGRVLRRFSTRSDNGMAASPDGHTLYYSFSGAIWAQSVAGDKPKRLTEGIDVTLDPKGQYLYVKRVRNGLLAIVRIPAAGGDAEELPLPAEYHVVIPTGLSPAAVDARGRILVSAVSKHSFFYQTAILDAASKSFTLVPIAVDGDAAMAGWAPDGRILARGHRYLFSLWRYQRSNNLR